MRLTQLAHDRLRAHLQPGDWALDATCGNGKDTLMLAEAVGPTGSVWAIDLQPAAIEQTRLALKSAGHVAVTLIQADHGEMLSRLPVEASGSLAAVTFNLGYLPGGDKSLVTKTESTLVAIHAAKSLLKPCGLLSVIAYPGHPGGAEECAAVRDCLENWVATEDGTLEVIASPTAHGPVWLLYSHSAGNGKSHRG